ncbi:MAG: type 4a pilus biogenesis protein PilO [Proteobacteria bacterium]|nr:type 4a pilus biogenesis protein PilO [Pseudomonadota bacterium]
MKKLEMDFKGISKKIAKIKRIYKLLFSIGLNVLLFALLYYLVLSPQLETKRQFAQEYSNIKRELDNMVAIKNNMPKFRKEYAQLQELLQQMLKQLPETKDIPNLLRNISTVGTETRLKITYFEPRPVQNKEYYSELPFSIRYIGPFHHIGYFFDGIRKLERIINVTSFSISPDSKKEPGKLNLTGECTAKTYVYLKQQPKDEKKVEKKDEKKDGKGETPKK